MSIRFSRHEPSARYRELLNQYESMHRFGEQHHRVPPEQTFAGHSLPRHAQAIKQLIDRCQARTILDYGSGKGLQYTAMQVFTPDGRRFESIPEYWGVDTVTCYDPGYAPFSSLPEGTFDGVICTDVLEHCPESDLDWILDELFTFARHFVYANVACYPAKKRLSNGENAHCTIRPAAWWESVVASARARHSHTRFEFHLDEVVTRSDGSAEIEPVVLAG